LRDVSIEQLLVHRSAMEELVFRRCRHVVTENARVLEAAASLEAGDLQHFGESMYESHRSLRDDYEVSCAELDLMVDLAKEFEGVYGARMTGGGFGGCTVNVVAADDVAEFKRSITAAYENATGLRPEIYVCETENGAEEVTPHREL
jgi:galactokinase